MKKLFFLFLVLIACQEEEFNPNSPSVDQFVQLLRNGNYDRNQPIPNFSPEQIPELLRYATSLEEIPAFPVNRISSLYQGNFRLGECMLWTIESIRLSYDQSLELRSPERYPSLNPMLINATALKSEAQVASDEEVLEAVQAYTDWWNNPASFEQKRGINPLENTSLTWY
jgi:hypothetical protein